MEIADNYFFTQGEIIIPLACKRFKSENVLAMKVTRTQTGHAAICHRIQTTEHCVWGDISRVHVPRGEWFLPWSLSSVGKEYIALDGTSVPKHSNVMSSTAQHFFERQTWDTRKALVANFVCLVIPLLLAIYDKAFSKLHPIDEQPTTLKTATVVWFMLTLGLSGAHSKVVYLFWVGIAIIQMSSTSLAVFLLYCSGSFAPLAYTQRPFWRLHDSGKAFEQVRNLLLDS